MTARKGRRVGEEFVLKIIAPGIFRDGVACVVRELSPAKLLRLDLEARSPSSKVQVGRDEERAQRGVDYGCLIVRNSMRSAAGVERSGIYRKRARSSGPELGVTKLECSHREGDNNRNLTAVGALTIFKPTAASSALALTSFMLSLDDAPPHLPSPFPSFRC